MAKEFYRSNVLGKEALQPGIIQLDLEWPFPAPRSGQFFLLKPSRSAQFLGRPISFAAKVSTVKPGQEETVDALRFLIAIKGEGTRQFAALQAGDEVLCTGPLGNSWMDMRIQTPGGENKSVIDLAIQGLESRASSLALIGGGVGVAPLLAFAQELELVNCFGVPYHFYGGFRAEPFGLERISFSRPIIAAEDGSACLTGLITDFLDPSDYAAVFACGPHPMLAVVAEKCRAAGTSCFVSLERPMACGVGACLGCTVTTRDGNRRCCTDGPIFNAEELIFNE